VPKKQISANKPSQNTGTYRFWVIFVFLPIILLALFGLIPITINKFWPELTSQNSSVSMLVTASGAILIMLLIPCFIMLIIATYKLFRIVKHSGASASTRVPFIVAIVGALEIISVVAFIAWPSATNTVQKSSTSDPMPTSYVSQSAVAHDYKVSMLFDPNSHIKTTYLEGSNDNGNVVGHLDRTIFSGKELKTNTKMSISILKISDDIYKTAFVCSGVQVGNTVTYINTFTFRNYVVAHAMGKDYALCGVDASDLWGHVQDADYNWYELHITSNDSSALNPDTINQIVSSIHITKK
jgi:hypothetical protein